MFRPSLACSPPHHPNLKTKIIISEDASCVNTWTLTGEKMGLPPSFRNLKVAANISVRSVWATNSQWGILYHTEDLMVCESEAERVCPFDAFMLDHLPENEGEHEEDGEGASVVSSR